MKKLLVLLLMLAMTVALASCDVQATVNKLLGKGEETPEHVHQYVITENTATCVNQGVATYLCECGHSYQANSDPTGHIWGDFVEASRMVLCTGEGCSAGYLADGNGKYSEVLVFKYTEEDKATLLAKFDSFNAELATLDAYDPALHAFAEEGELADAFKTFDAKHTDLYDSLLYAMEQRQLAEILYFCDMNNADKKLVYDDMTEYYTEIVGKFYALSQPIYDSMYREFFYQGMTPEEITNYLADSAAYSDPAYIEIKTRNDEIESRFYSIDPTSNQVSQLYYEFVQNNKAIVEHFNNKSADGQPTYDNYIDYAYSVVYDRDYSYQDIDVVVGYVKQYITPLFNSFLLKYTSSSSLRNTEYSYQAEKSFFENTYGNITLNDYVDLLAFTSNDDKQISFSDEFNNLIGNGNMFRGTYEGAFVTYIYSLELPIAYFGQGYDSAFTVAHEFGHYMNEVYNESEFNQSFDLLEMHSQGNEMLYLAFLMDQLSADGYKFTKVNTIFNMLATILASVSVDAFERAVYTNTYNGKLSTSIMADGVISAGEYDRLYYSILCDLGIEEVINNQYWRYMTITSPCYYISYAISGLSVLQLYPKAVEDFDTAAESYLKLFTYTDSYVGDDYTELTTVQILENAGLYSFTDEELYKYLRANLK